MSTEIQCMTKEFYSLLLDWIIQKYRVRVPVPRYYFSKLPSTGTAVLLKITVPTSECL